MTLDYGIENLQVFLGSVDKRLKDQIPENIAGIGRLLQASGKRYRPSLVIATAFYSGKKIDSKVLDAAVAVELVHVASLIHDDIIDNGTLRWGVPTINSKEGENIAILAGDYLFAKGCALASRVSAEAGEVMAETIIELCNGQAIELHDQFNVERTVESLNLAIKGKTSSMFIASCVLGGIAAGLDTSQLKILTEFGENFGIYYQYMDDVKDFVESTESSGKSVGNDIREGNYTLPVILSLQDPHKSTLKKLLKNSDPQIRKILENDDSIHRTITMAKKYKQEAFLTLQKLDNQELVNGLRSFVDQF